jgi:hypothetical protein
LDGTADGVDAHLDLAWPHVFHNKSVSGPILSNEVTFGKLQIASHGLVLAEKMNGGAGCYERMLGIDYR